MKKCVVTLCLFITIPLFLKANAGSPMMWFGMLHLVTLNAIIGVVESVIVDACKMPNKIGLIILANYVSMVVGMYWIAPFFAIGYGNKDFWGGETRYGDYNLRGFFGGMIIAFIVSLLVEYPFFRLAVKEEKNKSKIFLPFLIANLVTNSLMIICYYLIVKSGGHW